MASKIFPETEKWPNEGLDSQHDEGQFSECYLGAAEGNLASDVFTVLAMFQINLKVSLQTYSVCQCLILADTMLASERFLDLVLREAVGQAVKDDEPACR